MKQCKSYFHLICNILAVTKSQPKTVTRTVTKIIKTEKIYGISQLFSNEIGKWLEILAINSGHSN